MPFFKDIFVIIPNSIDCTLTQLYLLKLLEVKMYLLGISTLAFSFLVAKNIQRNKKRKAIDVVMELRNNGLWKVRK